ncbi:MAG: acyl-CoA dehydrogenase family protein [Pelagibacterales bacterium]|nr:acyl-CoA dehydrogenase family protein [Pelagibacterales bacterium]|tara:strand:+ start:20 stop:1222 length:1203 start_codon:yes stop_codon:yes gene_type:complete
MDTTFSTEDTKFQLEVRTFIEENYPKSLRESVNTKRKNGEELTRDELTAWHKVLGAHNGWSAPGWPAKFGGAEFTPTQKYIFEQECARAECQYIIPFGINMCAPVIYTFGNEEQKAQHLPGILSGETFWCQGYSEPGSGSDLASLKTAAVKEGDHYIVNGQKTWTTLAQHADWIFCLVRTNPEAAKPQEGISFLLIDMKTPGISIRPIYLMDGTNEVNEVWFDNVKVPAENLIGTENQGWTYAKFLLAHERSGIAGVARSKKAIERVKQIAASEMSYGEPLIQDPAFIRKIADAELELTALEYTELRTLAKDSAGKGPGAESSILKIKGTDLQQRVTELAMEAIGYYANPHMGTSLSNEFIGPDYATNLSGSYFNFRKASIYGGSNEIQRNIIAKMVLGL